MLDVKETVQYVMDEFFMRRSALLLFGFMLSFPVLGDADEAQPTDSELYVQPTPNVDQHEAQDLTRGIRFDGHLSAVAQSPSDLNRLYVGTSKGRVHVSRDGGLSWEETTIHTHKRPFVGALRGFEVPNNSLTRPLLVSPLSNARLNQFYLPSRLFDPEITTGTDVQPPSTAFFDDSSELSRATRGISPRRLRDPIQGLVRSTYADQTIPDTLGFEDGRGSGASDLAIGIRARAPWLAYQVRRRRKWGLGINLMQSIYLKGSPKTEVRFLDVSPTNPDVVLAATMDGLYRSNDAGYAWSLVLTGANPREREITMLRRHPNRVNTVYAGTSQGLKVSSDGGETWRKVTHRLTESNPILWLEFGIDNPDVILVGLTGGALMSTDGGRNFTRIFVRPWPKLSYVRIIKPDPHNPNWIWLGTYDGLMLSKDGGRSFERMGGLLFTGHRISRIVFGDTPGRLFATTERNLWTSADDGKTWRFVNFGSKTWWVEAMIKDARSQDSAILVTQHEILKYGPRTATNLTSNSLKKYRAWVAFEPTMTTAVNRALKRAGLARGDLMAYRRQARKADYLPDLHFVAKVGGYSTDRGFLNPFLDVVRPLEARLAEAAPVFWGVFLKWNLQELTFSTQEVVTRRVGRTNIYGEQNLRRQVIALYEERQRLMFERLTTEQTLKQQLHVGLRIEELTAHLNKLTGDLFPAFNAF